MFAARFLCLLAATRQIKEYSYYIDEHGYKVNDSEIKKSEDITYPYYDEDTGILHIEITPNNVTLKNNNMYINE